MESGSNKILKLVKKGADARVMIDAGLKVKESGISLCFYIMPGLGGKNLSRENAVKTASVLNVVNPDFIRVRTLFISPGTPIFDLRNSGKFKELPEIEVLKEIRLLISRLKNINSRFVSDHSLNLLIELNGNLPRDKNKLIRKIDKFLNLADEEKINFIVGRRSGIYSKLSDLENPSLYSNVDRIINNLNNRNVDISGYLNYLKSLYI